MNKIISHCLCIGHYDELTTILCIKYDNMHVETEEFTDMVPNFEEFLSEAGYG
jgi:hypothetical protein